MLMLQGICLEAPKIYIGDAVARTYHTATYLVSSNCVILLGGVKETRNSDLSRIAVSKVDLVFLHDLDNIIVQHVTLHSDVGIVFLSSHCVARSDIKLFDYRRYMQLNEAVSANKHPESGHYMFCNTTTGP